MAEIELKAHVDNPSDCKKKLTALVGKGIAISKDDTYWFAPAVLRYFSGPRVRHETAENSEKTLVTWKSKEKQNGIEVNDEHEFEISKREPSPHSPVDHTGGKEIEELFMLLGLEKQIAKHKQGWSWHYDGITIELCEVSGTVNKKSKKSFSTKHGRIKKLGWFLELEIIAPEGSDATVAEARDKLFALLEKAGLGKEHLESRYYTEILEQ